MLQQLWNVRLHASLQTFSICCVFFSSDPGQPNVFLNAKSATSLNLTWDVFNITDAPYTVEWEKTGCLAKDRENKGSITTNDTSYSITELEEGSKYNITVSAGDLSSNTIVAVTIEKGEESFVVIMVFSNSYL